MKRASRRARGEEGVSLLLALGFLALFGLAIPPLLNLASTNFLATSRLHEQRAVVYVADGATDGALQYLRSHPQCGRPLQTVGTCPISTGSTTAAFSATLNNKTAVATITATGTPLQLDRSITISTSVDGVPRIQVSAIVRDTSQAAESPIDVTSWKYIR